MKTMMLNASIAVIFFPEVGLENSGSNAACAKIGLMWLAQGGETVHLFVTFVDAVGT